MTPESNKPNEPLEPRGRGKRRSRKVEGYWKSLAVSRSPKQEAERHERILEADARRRERQAADIARGPGRRHEVLGRMLRGRLVDVIALTVLIVLGLTTALVIISSQKAALPGWIPVLGQDFYHLDAEFQTAQAVTPGQGQSVTISGINVGQISSSRLEDGKAIVGMNIEPKYAQLVHPDASLLLRPKTNLNDMTVELDPGVAPGELKAGSTIPESRTEPNVNPEAFLNTLDTDTRNWLSALLQAGGEGIGGDAKGRQLSAVFRRLEPFTRDIASVNGAVAQRRENLAHVVHSFRLLAEELSRNDTQLARFVGSSDAALGDFASQQVAIRDTVQQLPGALDATNRAVRNSDQLSQHLAPALRELTPQAHSFAPALRASQSFFNTTTPVLRSQVRPFAEQIAPTIRALAPTGKPFATTVKGFRDTLKPLNYGFNELAYDPPGPQNGYLYYLPWLNHDLNATYLTQDAGGPLRRGLVMLSCNTTTLANGFANGRPFLKTLLQLTNVPTPQQAC